MVIKEKRSEELSVEPDVVIITSTLRANLVILVSRKQTHRGRGLSQGHGGGGGTETELEPWLSAYALWGFSVECALGWLTHVREGHMDPKTSPQTSGLSIR